MNYLPSDLINEDYEYFFNGRYYIVRYDCESTLCSCKSIFPMNNYLVSEEYECNDTLPFASYKIPSNVFIDDYYYRIDFSQVLIIFTIIVLFGFGIPFYLLKKFKRTL